KLLVAACVAALALAVLFVRPARPAEPAIRFEQPAPRVARTAAPRPVVYVAGRVARPGLYALSGTARVDDAVRAAGGIARGGDPVAVNLAQHVSDGEEIVVPPLGETPAVSAVKEKRRSKGPRHRHRRAVPTGHGDAAGTAASGI
ncbi:MAG TPA: SLBB domain-containing protein, partial [Candidatus Acidoferrales bacterium]|nr:SLBB domain-containing protein [Candidatus Acidoferrales bacterium]